MIGTIRKSRVLRSVETSLTRFMLSEVATILTMMYQMSMILKVQKHFEFLNLARHHLLNVCYGVQVLCLGFGIWGWGFGVRGWVVEGNFKLLNLLIILTGKLAHLTKLLNLTIQYLISLELGLYTSCKIG